MRSKKVKTALALAFVIGVVTVLHYAGLLTGIEQLLRRAVTPASKAIYSVSVNIGDRSEHFDSVDELRQAYSALRQNSSAEQVAQVELELLRQENTELRKQLRYFETSDVFHTGAEVIGSVVGKNIEPFGTTLVINKGKQHGISIDDPVIAGTGILVGKIIRVQEDSAIIQLLTDNRSKIAATIMNSEYSIGVVEGGYDLSVRMSLIPQNERISVGDTVITSGLEDSIPRGLLIGTVDVVQRETYEAFQEAVISPFVSFDDLRIVSIITRRN